MQNKQLKTLLEDELVKNMDLQEEIQQIEQYKIKIKGMEIKIQRKDLKIQTLKVHLQDKEETIKELDGDLERVNGKYEKISFDMKHRHHDQDEVNHLKYDF